MKRTRCKESPFPESSYPPEGFLRRIRYLWGFTPVPFFGFSDAQASGEEPWSSRRARPSRREIRCGPNGYRREQ
jgi:hypothetical protein